ncbi:hypothetical protein BsWGS_22275 [Bradybaena similaris]
MATPKTTTQLSKNVLQMKFMQRSVLRLEREQNEEDKQKIIDDEHWVLDHPEYKSKESKFLKDQSYITCEQLMLGRQSFQGFNPEIEKLMKTQLNEQELKKIDANEKQNSIGDKEMASRYSSLMSVIAKKFATKRKVQEASHDEEEAPSHKKCFMKPSDVD